jgi:hypothetical protein
MPRSLVSVDDDGFLDPDVKIAEAGLPRRLSAQELRDTFVPKDSPLFTGDFTKEGIGLGNVDNTSDLDKPVSTATQAAIAAQLGAGGGVPSTNPSFTGVTSFKDDTGTTLASVNANGEYQHEIPGAGIVLRATGGQRYRIVIGDDGAITSIPLV